MGSRILLAQAALVSEGVDSVDHELGAEGGNSTGCLGPIM
jgi:hypothetical protein